MEDPDQLPDLSDALGCVGAEPEDRFRGVEVGRDEVLPEPLQRVLHPLQVPPRQRPGLAQHAAGVEDAQRLVHSVLRIYRNVQALLDYSERDTLTGLLNRKTFDESFLKVALGPATPIPGNARVTVSGVPVLLMADPAIVPACSAKPPCVMLRLAASARVRVSGQPLALATGVVSVANGLTATVTAIQQRVMAK